MSWQTLAQTIVLALLLGAASLILPRQTAQQLQNGLVARLLAELEGMLTRISAATTTAAGAGDRAPLALVEPPHGPLTWLPTWSQTAGRLPDGNPDPQQYSDCGETCIAMVLGGVFGVELEPGALREQLGGPSRPGVTSALDLAQLLADNHVSHSVQCTDAHGLGDALRTCWANAWPAVILGTWLGGDVLHWVLLRSWDASSIDVCDPWTGTARRFSTGEVLAMYRGWLVTALAHCHYDMSRIPTPGSQG